MVRLDKIIKDVFLVTVLIIFAIISWGWIRNYSTSDSNSMIALATIVYAIFTFFMFWNMKSSSETQIRPLLITNFDEKFNLHLLNKIEKNIAKKVKVRVKVIPIKHYKEDTKLTIFLNKIGFGNKREWTIWDYFWSHNKYYEIFEDTTKINVLDYILKKVGDIQSSRDRHNELLIYPKEKERVVFRLLVHISYDSLLDITYGSTDGYLVKVKKDKIEINKEII